MEMCYDGTLVMPSSYAIMNEEEMTYLEGGATVSYRGTASDIRKRLDVVIAVTALGIVDIAALGALLGNVKGAIVGAIGGTILYGPMHTYAKGAHNDVEKIINKYGKNKKCVLQSTWSTVFCTGISVSVA